MEEDGGGGALYLTMLTAGSTRPKLEDFPGGCGREPMGQFSEDIPGAPPNGGDRIYYTDLKTIAVGFLRGYPVEQQEVDGGGSSTALTVVVAAEATSKPKKAVDTFGQRTSIYVARRHQAQVDWPIRSAYVGQLE